MGQAVPATINSKYGLLKCERTSQLEPNTWEEGGGVKTQEENLVGTLKSFLTVWKERKTLVGPVEIFLPPRKREKVSGDSGKLSYYESPNGGGWPTIAVIIPQKICLNSTKSIREYCEPQNSMYCSK